MRLGIAMGAMFALIGVGLSANTGSVPVMIGVAQPERARTNWILKCQGCHRPDGSGSSATTPALTGKVGQFTNLPGGRAYLGRVPGVADAALTDVELAELLNWTLQHFDPANLQHDFKPYTAQEIGQLRRTPLRTDATATREAILNNGYSDH